MSSRRSAEGASVCVIPQERRRRECREQSIPSGQRSATEIPVIILVADGVRPDTLGHALDGGALPALARLGAEGGMFTITSAFPSVTGPAYAPFLMGRYPGPVGLPGLRWYDRERRTASYPHYTRSYVGWEMRCVDSDLDPSAPTMFELAGRSLGALSVIGRGLAARESVGRGVRFMAGAARTHFQGDVGGWLTIDSDVGGEIVRRIRTERLDFVFAAFTGVDKTSHSAGHGSPLVMDALRIVDRTAASLREVLEADGRWSDTHLWLVSDHGHSAVHHHEDLAGLLRSWGHRTIAHPWVFGGASDAAVMVSGNAMAHVYLELARRERPWWPAMATRWEPLAEQLLERESVDLLLLPHDADSCEVRARGRGAAFVQRIGDSYSYLPRSGDPLALGGELSGLDARDAYDACSASDYPDALVQIANLAGASRSGEMIISASRDWDLRARYEPIPHVSSHGALHSEHMLVPLIVNRAPGIVPRRTVDVMPSACAALGVKAPAGVDGMSFL